MGLRDQIAEVLGVQSNEDRTILTLSKGEFTLRQGYFWRPRCEPDQLFAKSLEKLQGFDLVDVCYGSEDHPFRGGESIKRNSHYWMKFRLAKK